MRELDKRRPLLVIGATRAEVAAYIRCHFSSPYAASLTTARQSIVVMFDCPSCKSTTKAPPHVGQFEPSKKQVSSDRPPKGFCAAGAGG